MQSFSVSTDKEHIVDKENLKNSIKMWIKIMESEWFKEKPENVRKLYEKYPPWRFYTNKEGTIPYRVYGVGECDDGTLVLETASGKMMMTNLTVGGCNPEDLIPVKKYEGDAFDILRHNPDYRTFTRPSGWTDFINN